MVFVTLAAAMSAENGANWSPKWSGTKWSRIRKVEYPSCSVRRASAFHALAVCMRSLITPKRKGRDDPMFFLLRYTCRTPMWVEGFALLTQPGPWPSFAARCENEPESPLLGGPTLWRETDCGSSTRTPTDRKSTRLNSSHGYISYAVFCLKKKKNQLDVLLMSKNINSQ